MDGSISERTERSCYEETLTALEDMHLRSNLRVTNPTGFCHNIIFEDEDNINIQPFKN